MKDTDDMRSIITEHKLFKPTPTRPETKADITNHVARTIIGAESERREAKTARLRLARLQAAAKEPSVAASKQRRPRSAAPRRGRSSM